MTLDFVIKPTYQSTTVGIKYYMCDLLCEVNNFA